MPTTARLANWLIAAPDAGIAFQGRAHRAQHFAQLARECCVGVSRGLDHRLTRLLPKSVDPQADRLVVEQFLLDRFDPLARFRACLQVVGELGERFLDLDPHGMCRVGRHFDRQLAQSIDDRVGELGVEPGQLERPIGLLVNHLANHRLVRLERPGRPADRCLEHRDVAVLVDSRRQRMAEERGDLGLSNPHGESRL